MSLLIMRWRFAAEKLRVRRLKTTRPSVISLLKRLCCLWVNAIGLSSVIVATSIMKIGDAAHVEGPNMAYQERQTPNAWSAGM